MSQNASTATPSSEEDDGMVYKFLDADRAPGGPGWYARDRNSRYYWDWMGPFNSEAEARTGWKKDLEELAANCRSIIANCIAKFDTTKAAGQV